MLNRKYRSKYGGKEARFMYCFKCGKEIQGNPVYCPNCGAMLGETDKSTPFSPYSSEENSLVQAESANVVSDGYAAGEAQPVLGMKWFKFIIYFQLFASMLMLIRDGVTTATGAQYGGDAEFIYALWPSLKTIDILYAIFCFVLAAFALYVRMSLAKYKEQGPKLYLTLLICNLVFPFLYLAAASLATGISMSELFSADLIGGALALIILIFVNKKYFNNRKHLFTAK